MILIFLYYDTNSNNHLHGTIYLKDVTSVAEAEPQTVPTVKAESGFFFNVSSCSCCLEHSHTSYGHTYHSIAHFIKFGLEPLKFWDK